MLNEETVRFKVEHLRTASTIPTMVKKLLEVLDDPALSLREIGTFVSNDPLLTAHLLKAVNSPLFGFTGRVTSITQALLLLGLNAAKGLLLGVEAFRHAKGLEELWAHSVGTAIVARVTGKKAGLKETEDLFVAGLIHDIGKVFLNLKLPNEYHRALTLAHTKGALIIDTEKEIFETTHAEVASWVLERWHLSPRLIEPIRYHHEPSLAKKQSAGTAVIHFSDVLTRALGFGSGGDALVPRIDEKAWARLNLSRAEIKDILWESEELMQEAENFFVDA
jgi:HD-like signal output (HDOD) protein